MKRNIFSSLGCHWALSPSERRYDVMLYVGRAVTDEPAISFFKIGTDLCCIINSLTYKPKK
jgi:hypothetical protein